MTDSRLEARYRSADMHAPVLLRTEDDVDDLIDSLLTGPPLHDAVHLLSRARPLTWTGLPDHVLHVGVSREREVGALMLSAPEVGLVASAGVRRSRSGVVHHVAGHWTEFPNDAEIPLSRVRDAVVEFLHSGGGVPTCVAWKPIDMAAVDVEDDQDPWTSPGGQEAPNGRQQR